MNPRTVVALAGLPFLMFSLVGCSATNADVEVTPEPITAGVSCGQFGDVQTIVFNAQTARKDLRMEEQEYQGWLRLAARVLSRIDVQPDSDLAIAVQHAQDSAPAAPLGSIVPSGINESTVWFEAVDEVRIACEAGGAEFALEGFVGG
jgi:hypothetical protein